MFSRAAASSAASHLRFRLLSRPPEPVLSDASPAPPADSRQLRRHARTDGFCRLKLEFWVRGFVISKMLTAILFVLSAAFVKGVFSLTGVYLSMPDGVKLGQPVTLTCSFQLEGDTLYTVKWYKFQDEFYRYTPKENPPTKFFSVAGIPEGGIDKNRSNGTVLTLRHMTEEMSGLYSCEVSADAPSFQTATVSRNVMVVDPPRGKPKIYGLKPKYKLDEALHVNCTAPGSRPAANLTWTINGNIPARKHVDDRRRMVDGDLEQTISSLRIHAREANFPGGQIRIVCTASIYQVYEERVSKAAILESTSRQGKTQVNSAVWPDVQVGWSPSYPHYRHTPLPPTEELITGEDDDILEESSNGSTPAVHDLLLLQIAAIASVCLT